ncbi:hypothetical protein JRQ81_006828 [Phrynocephalus forsythii]|uniref:Uncharacterized protein n=1 Tax=Phrynocephalus forsythii TaxID=171643 RepID=A0A9Q0XDY2_9SAUR|nr:hypothetical protein JRQ81_006828 [Phrynocephalus forsythii]
MFSSTAAHPGVAVSVVAQVQKSREWNGGVGGHLASLPVIPSVPQGMPHGPAHHHGVPPPEEFWKLACQPPTSQVNKYFCKSQQHDSHIRGSACLQQGGGRACLALRQDREVKQSTPFN